MEITRIYKRNEPFINNYLSSIRQHLNVYVFRHERSFALTPCDAGFCTLGHAPRSTVCEFGEKIDFLMILLPLFLVVLNCQWFHGSKDALTIFLGDVLSLAGWGEYSPCHSSEQSIRYFIDKVLQKCPNPLTVISSNEL